MATIAINVDRIARKSSYTDLGKGYLLVYSKFVTIQGEGPFAGRRSLFLRLAGCNFGDKKDHCQWCFPPSHKISTPKGRTTFGELCIGDELYTLDSNGEVTTTKIKKLATREVPWEDMVQLVISVDGVNKKLTCTKDHPINTSNRGFVAAGDLKKSDRIVHVKSYELNNLRMSISNPMYDAEILSDVHKKLSAKRDSGELVPYIRTPEIRAQMAASKIGNKNPMKRHEVRLKNALSHDYPKSKFETKFENLFKILRLKLKYVGSGEDMIAIGSNELGWRIPDFKLPGNKVIEIYSRDKKYSLGKRLVRRTVKNYEIPTREHYEAHGYEVLFLTEDDIPQFGQGSGNKLKVSSKEDYEDINNKLMAFKRNGARLVSKKPLATSARKRIKANGMVDVVSVSCDKDHTFIVNDIHTHNCDTKFQLDKGRPSHFEEILNAVNDANVDLLVVTGGEPLLQPHIVEATKFLLSERRDLHVQFETNGTQRKAMVDLLQLSVYYADRVTIICSPKASAKTGYVKVAPMARDLVVSFYKNFFYKFVVTSDILDTHHVVPEWANEVAANVYVSPMTIYERSVTDNEVASAWDTTLVNHTATRANYKRAAYLAMQNNFMVSIQMHTWLDME